MDLIIDGIKYDSSIEKEIIAPDGFCFTIEINYNKDFHIPYYSRVVEQYTEVHNRFRNFLLDSPEIAFESDILQTGFTRKLSYLESVIITTVEIK